MTNRTFYTRGGRAMLWLAWFVVVTSTVGSILGIHNYGRNHAPSSLLGSVLAALWAAWMALGVWNYRRPALEISKDEIVHGSILSISRRRIPCADVAEVTAKSSRRLVLRTRSGRGISLWLGMIRKSERGAARAAIEAAVADSRRGAH